LPTSVNPERRPIFVAVAIGMAIGSVLVSPHSAYALCAASAVPVTPQSMLQGTQPGQVLFVGTVAETRAAGYNALFHVEQVWYGAPLNEWATLRGSNDESWLALEEDVPKWQVGERYLVAAQRDGADLRSTTCSYPFRLGDSLTQTGRAVEVPPLASWRPVLWAWQPLIRTLFIPMSAVFAAVIAVLAVLGWRRRRRRPEAEDSP
jgi:hypothetical protein